MWSAIRALHERSMLAHRLAERAQERNLNRSAARFAEQAEEALRNADVIRQLLLRGHDEPSDPE